jgi:uncharacterized membrane protein
MSQNRLATRDRIEAHNDFLINQKAEEEVRAILVHLEAQNQALLTIHEMIDGLDERGGGRAAPDDPPPGPAAS